MKRKNTNLCIIVLQPLSFDLKWKLSTKKVFTNISENMSTKCPRVRHLLLEERKEKLYELSTRFDHVRMHTRPLSPQMKEAAYVRSIPNFVEAEKGLRSKKSTTASEQSSGLRVKVRARATQQLHHEKYFSTAKRKTQNFPFLEEKSTKNDQKNTREIPSVRGQRRRDAAKAKSRSL